MTSTRSRIYFRSARIITLLAVESQETATSRMREKVSECVRDSRDIYVYIGIPELGPRRGQPSWRAPRARRRPGSGCARRPAPGRPAAGPRR